VELLLGIGFRRPFQQFAANVMLLILMFTLEARTTDLFSYRIQPFMSRDFCTLDELVQRLGRDRRQVEKLVNRGIIPGRRVGGDWRFNEIEITHWLEQDLRGLDDQGLAQLEQSQYTGDQRIQSPIAEMLHPETCEIPLDAGTRPAVLQALIEVAGRTWQVWDPASILKAVKEREDVMSTGFENGIAIILRKEVIQPQVPLRLPCYDLVPITKFALGTCLLTVSTATSAPPAFVA
jgi:excisionase family DNA binding protein